MCMIKNIFIVVLFFMALCNNTDIVTITETDKNNLRHLKETLWPKAYREQDTVLLEKILGDDYKLIDADGNWSDKQAEINWISKNPWPVDSFRFEIKRFEFLENGTAIVAGTGHVVEDSTESIYQSSNFFIKRNGEWKAVASHVSGFKQIKTN